MALDFTDFYIKFPGHPKFNDIEIIEDEIIKVIIQKIEMILFTNRGELLGDPNFGGDLQRYLFETNVNADFVKGELAKQFSDYIPELDDIGYELNVTFSQNPMEFSDMMFIDVKIRDAEVNAFFG
jgi:hypothetical protein